MENRISVPHQIRRIQYIRAIAVIGVLLYHFKFGFSRGYFGVDIFFVVSGFVITRSILLKNSMFKFKQSINFYASRVLRLFPAFAVMNLFVLVGSLLFLSPNIGVQQQVIKSGFGSILGISNIVIPRFTGGYFETPSQLNPYLHTWSLSVEEQFYLIFPILMIFYFHSFSRNIINKTKLVTIFLISFFSFYFTFNPESFSALTSLSPVYFSTISRFWQFILGFFAAKLVLSNNKSLKRFKCLFWPILLIQIGLMNMEEINFDFSIMLVTFLTAILLISASQETKTDSRNKFEIILEYVGSRSYSIYLWHWPIIVLLPAAVVGLSNITQMLIAAILTLGISEISYSLIEVKAKKKFEGLTTRLFVTSTLVLSLIVVLMFSSALFVKNGLWQSWSLTSHKAIKKNCDIGLNELPTTVNVACQWASKLETNPKKSIYLFGDSLSWSGADSVIDAGNRLGYTVRLFTRNGCYARLSDRDDITPCGEWSRNVFYDIELNKPSVIFLFGNFTTKELPLDTMNLLRNLSEIKQKTVIMLPPPWGDSYSEMKSFVNFGLDRNRNGSRPLEISVPAEYKKDLFRVFNPSDSICKDLVCPISVNGNELYNYGNHLSVYGNAFLTKPLIELLRRLN